MQKWHSSSLKPIHHPLWSCWHLCQFSSFTEDTLSHVHHVHYILLFPPPASCQNSPEGTERWEDPIFIFLAPNGRETKFSYCLACLPAFSLRLGMYPRKLVLRTYFSSKSFCKCNFLKFYRTEEGNIQVFVFTAQKTMLLKLYFASDNFVKMFITGWTMYSFSQCCRAKKDINLVK